MVICHVCLLVQCFVVYDVRGRGASQNIAVKKGLTDQVVKIGDST